jgi:AraC-like DNA-binding protein
MMTDVDERRSAAAAFLGPRPPERPIRRLGLPVASRRLAAWDGVEAELIKGGTCGPHEMEIFMPSHSVWMRCEGSSPGYEWSDGTQRRKVPALRPGSILFTPANQYGWIGKRSHTGGTFLTLSIDTDVLQELSNDGLDASTIEFVASAHLDDEPIRRTLFAIRDDIATPGFGGELYRSLLAQLLIIQLVRCASNLAPDRGPTLVKGGLSGWQLRRALELLEADLTRPPSLRQLSEHVGLSPTYFCKAFRQSTGMPPHRYLTERRIALAKDLIARRELSLTEIALSTGFGSSSHFSVAFRNAVGVAPIIYQRSL